MTDCTYDGGWGFILLVISLSLVAFGSRLYMGVLQIGGVALIMVRVEMLTYKNLNQVH